MFLELCLRFIYNLECPSYMLLVLLKALDIYESINVKLEKVYNKKIKNQVFDTAWTGLNEIKLMFHDVLLKMKTKIQEEGGDINLTYNAEVNQLILYIYIFSDNKNLE